MPMLCGHSESCWWNPHCKLCEWREWLRCRSLHVYLIKPKVPKKLRWPVIRPKLVETINAAVPDTVDAWFKERYPALFESLSRPKADDGATRERHSVFLVWEDGCFRLCVRDRQEGCEAWVSCVRFLDALNLVETAVATGEGSWKAIPQKGKKKRG